MGRKTSFLIASYFLLFSCSQKGSLRDEKVSEIKSESIFELPDIDVPLEKTQIEFKPVKNWAVWVRGVAVDSFAGLGFMQQMEEMGYRPSKVAGTGMGCWLALSWALRNKGNYAEWQSMKFDSWEGLSQSFMGRIGSTSRKQKFIDYINRLQSSQKQALYEIPVECPLFDRKKKSLDLARDLKLEGRLFKQFDLAILGFGKFTENEEYSSGASFRSHGEEFLESLSEDFGQDRDETAWLILETTANHKLWGSAHEMARGVTRNGVRWLRLPLGKNLKISAQQLKDFKLRRRWLLEGRRDAKSFLHAQDIKDFLGL